MASMGGAPSESVLAARRQFEEISSTASARMGASEQACTAANDKAAEADRQFTANVQKVEKRVRELIDNRAAKQDSLRDNEIQVVPEDEEDPQDEVAIEFKELIENFPIAEPAKAVEDSAESTGPMPRIETPPPPDPRWQVQAGRFGRRPQSAAKPPPPAPPKPAPRRSTPVLHDEDDFENHTWLR